MVADDPERQDRIILPPQSATDAPRIAGDAHTRDLWRWLDQVLADRELTSFAFTVAYAITKHISREAGEAWPSQARIAEMVGGRERGVRSAVEQLASREHLQIKTPVGRKGGNRYRPIWHGGAGNGTVHRHGGAGNGTVHRHGGAGNGTVHRHGGAGNGTVHRHGDAGEDEFHRHGGAGLTGMAMPPNHMNEPLDRKTLPQTDSVENQPANPKSKPKPTRPTSDGGFNEFWLCCPRKVEKADTRKAYDKAIASGGATHAELLAGMMRYAAERTAEVERDPERVRFTKHPATWLNKGCWSDGETSGRTSTAANVVLEIRGIPVPEKKIFAAITRWREGEPWHKPFGPPPNEPGCWIPRQILERAGVAT